MWRWKQGEKQKGPEPFTQSSAKTRKWSRKKKKLITVPLQPGKKKRGLGSGRREEKKDIMEGNGHLVWEFHKKTKGRRDALC